MQANVNKTLAEIKCKNIKIYLYLLIKIILHYIIGKDNITSDH